MSDIFGRNLRKYKSLTAFQREGILEAQLQLRCEETAELKYADPDHNAPHDFNVDIDHLVVDSEAAAYGIITNNFQALSSMVYETWYREHILPDFIPIVDNGIPEGATTYQIRYRDGRSKGRLASRFEGSKVTGDSTRQAVDAPLYLGANDCEYTDEDARNSLMANIPLQAEKIEDTTKGCNDHLEEVGFIGDQDIPNSLGLLNQVHTGNDATAVRYVLDQTTDPLYTGVTDDDQWTNLTALEQINVLQNAIGRLITNTKTLIVNKPGTVCVVLPPSIHNIVASTPKGPDTDRTVKDFVTMANPFTNADRQNRQIEFKMLQELEDINSVQVNNSNKRILVYFKSTDVMEMCIPFAPRIKRMYQNPRGMLIPFEYKYSEFNVKRNKLITYIDGV